MDGCSVEVDKNLNRLCFCLNSLRIHLLERARTEVTCSRVSLGSSEHQRILGRKKEKKHVFTFSANSFVPDAAGCDQIPLPRVGRRQYIQICRLPCRRQSGTNFAHVMSHNDAKEGENRSEEPARLKNGIVLNLGISHWKYSKMK